MHDDTAMSSGLVLGQPPVVCHLVESLLHGGAEAVIHRLAVGSQTTGYRAIVCCFRPGPLVPLLERDGVTVEVLNLERPSVLSGPRFIRFMVQMTSALRRVVERHNVSLLHAHLPDSILCAVLVGMLEDIPVIGTYQGLGIIPRQRHRFDVRNAVRRAGYRWAHRLCRRTIVVSHAIRELLCGQFGFRPATLVVVNNAIDTGRFVDARDDGRLRTIIGRADGRVITCIGRLVPGKGQRYLIESMRDLVGRFDNVHLVLVGDGPDRGMLESVARDSGVQQHVHILGDRSDVAELLAASEVFVLPTFSEGLPVSVVEAMAAAKPVVVTAIPGNREVVGDERCGMFVPVADAPALTAAIGRLLEDPQSARAMGLRAQVRARAHFDVRHMVAQTTAVYDSVLQECGHLQPSTA